MQKYLVILGVVLLTGTLAPLSLSAAPHWEITLIDSCQVELGLQQRSLEARIAKISLSKGWLRVALLRDDLQAPWERRTQPIAAKTHKHVLRLLSAAGLEAFETAPLSELGIYHGGSRRKFANILYFIDSLQKVDPSIPVPTMREFLLAAFDSLYCGLGLPDPRSAVQGLLAKEASHVSAAKDEGDTLVKRFRDISAHLVEFDKVEQNETACSDEKITELIDDLRAFKVGEIINLLEKSDRQRFYPLILQLQERFALTVSCCHSSNNARHMAQCYAYELFGALKLETTSFDESESDSQHRRLITEEALDFSLRAGQVGDQDFLQVVALNYINNGRYSQQRLPFPVELSHRTIMGLLDLVADKNRELERQAHEIAELRKALHQRCHGDD